MSSSPRQSPSAVLRSVLATAMVVLGLAMPWTSMSATALAAGTPASDQAAKAAGADEFSYSDLRDAIAARKVKAAMLQAGGVQGRGRPQGRREAHRRLLADR